MAKYLLYLVLLLPLTGILFMEQGVVSLSSYEFGYPNGASQMFLVYIGLILTSFFLVQKTSLLTTPLGKKPLDRFQLQHASFIALLTNIGITLVILFAFGSINVLLGNVHKGSFRVNLGPLGFVAMGVSRWTCPALLAFSTYIYTKSKNKTRNKKFLLFIHFIVCSFMAASWGFKSFAITILIPALIILYWEISLRKLLLLAVVAAFAIVFFGLLFDGGEISLDTFLGRDQLFENLSDGNILTAVLYRATVLQGDISWIMWERYTSGVQFPVYWWNLLAAFGNNISSLFLTPEEIKYYSYSTQLTSISTKIPISQLDGSYNVTGTVFSEGLMAGGVAGMIGFATFAGLFAGFIYKLIFRAMNRNRIVIVSISAVYFFKAFTWLNGGGIVGLFHFSHFVFITLTIILLKLIMLLSLKKANSTKLSTV